MLSSVRTALVLAPHTDDGDFGCGATVARLVEQGAAVHYLAFSDCIDSLPAGWPADTLVKELHAATARLGLPREHVHLAQFRVRHFTRDRQELLEQLVKFQRELAPDLVLMPSTNDLHQDHQTVAREGLRAFKRTTVLCYEIPWNNIQFRNELFVVVEERHLAKKLAAIQCYESQKDRYYADETFTRAQARLRGGQIGTTYAEVFEVVRAVFGSTHAGEGSGPGA